MQLLYTNLRKALVGLALLSITAVGSGCEPPWGLRVLGTVKKAVLSWASFNRKVPHPGEALPSEIRTQI